MSHIGDREPGETDSANDGISNRDLDRSLQSLDDARQVILLAMSRAEPGGEESLFSASQTTISPQSPGDVPLVAAYSELTSFRRQQDRALGGSEESSHCSRSTVWVSTTIQTYAHTLSFSELLHRELTTRQLNLLLRWSTGMPISRRMPWQSLFFRMVSRHCQQWR